MQRTIILTAMAALGGIGSAFAHHSTALYDYSKSTTLTGVVREFQWANPHCYLQLLVPMPSGKPVEWSIESGTPSVMTARLGWSKDALKPGYKVTVVIAPARDGSPGGTLRTVTLPDGRVLSTPTAGIKGDVKGGPAFGLDLPDVQHTTPKQQP